MSRSYPPTTPPPAPEGLYCRDYVMQNCPRFGLEPIRPDEDVDMWRLRLQSSSKGIFRNLLVAVALAARLE
jgi:hypothetical protein